VTYCTLIVLFLSFRWNEFRGILREGGHARGTLVRFSGVFLIVILALTEPFTGAAVESSVVVVALTFYAASLVVIPSARRLLLPYAVIVAVGMGGPFLLSGPVGIPWSYFDSALVSRLVDIFGFPVASQSTQFMFTSAQGGLITVLINPQCSGLYSVTAFLGLLALLHLDLRKGRRPTLALALVGVVGLTLLSSVRVALLIWIGYAEGGPAMLGVHDWIGYGLVAVFDLAAIIAYSRMGAGRPSGAPVRGPTPSPPWRSHPEQA
jgi:exosortase/archaeosortase family protein